MFHLGGGGGGDWGVSEEWTDSSCHQQLHAPLSYGWQKTLLANEVEFVISVSLLHYHVHEYS